MQDHWTQFQNGKSACTSDVVQLVQLLMLMLMFRRALILSLKVMYCTLVYIYIYLQPVVIVPEGKEPSQLLNLFKGKFIVHKAVSVHVSTSVLDFYM